jgi:hypothetical protein
MRACALPCAQVLLSALAAYLARVLLFEDAHRKQARAPAVHLHALLAHSTLACAAPTLTRHAHTRRREVLPPPLAA